MEMIAGAQKDEDNTALWALAGLGAGIGLLALLRPKEERPPGQTEAAPLPPLETPSEFETIGAVSTAFDDLLTNWRMGRIEPRATWDTTTRLYEAILDLRAAGVGEEATAQALIARIEQLREDIGDYAQLTNVV